MSAARPSEQPLDITAPHGGFTAYSRHGCRCDPCRDGAARRRSQQRARQAERAGRTYWYVNRPGHDWVDDYRAGRLA